MNMTGELLTGASSPAASAGTMKALNPATGQLIEPEFAPDGAAAGRNPEPTAAVIDSQPARAGHRATRQQRRGQHQEDNNRYPEPSSSRP